VDNYLKKTDAYNKLDMVKKEVWYDKDNAWEMVEALKRLGLNTNTWVPFILVRDIDWGESYLSGDTPIIDHFKPYLWEANQNTSINSDTDNNHNGTIVLVVLVIIAVWASFFFIKINK
jgi:hypothetical protein